MEKKTQYKEGKNIFKGVYLDPERMGYANSHHKNKGKIVIRQCENCSRHYMGYIDRREQKVCSISCAVQLILNKNETRTSN